MRKSAAVILPCSDLARCPSSASVTSAIPQEPPQFYHLKKEESGLADFPNQSSPNQMIIQTIPAIRTANLGPGNGTTAQTKSFPTQKRRYILRLKKKMRLRHKSPRHKKKLRQILAWDGIGMESVVFVGVIEKDQNLLLKSTKN